MGIPGPFIRNKISYNLHKIVDLYKMLAKRYKKRYKIKNPRSKQQ